MTAHQITVAADALAFATVAAVGLGMVIAMFDSGPAGELPADAIRAPRGSSWLDGRGGRDPDRRRGGGTQPVHLSEPEVASIPRPERTTPTTTRLLTTGGQRYDLWRVALKEFDSAPVLGVGADNYEFGYYRERATNRNLDDPHSFVFALLAESGIVGTALFALFLLGNITALGRGWRRLGRMRGARPRLPPRSVRCSSVRARSIGCS